MRHLVAWATPNGMSSSSSGSILVIDDEPVVRESLAVYLSDSGFSVDTARSGEEGLALFRSKKPDLVICDLRMPVVDGIDVLKKLLKEHALAEDDEKHHEHEVQKATDDAIRDIDALLAAKEKEIMHV